MGGGDGGRGGGGGGGRGAVRPGVACSRAPVDVHGVRYHAEPRTKPAQVEDHPADGRECLPGHTRRAPFVPGHTRRQKLRFQSTHEGKQGGPRRRTHGVLVGHRIPYEGGQPVHRHTVGVLLPQLMHAGPSEGRKALAAIPGPGTSVPASGDPAAACPGSDARRGPETPPWQCACWARRMDRRSGGSVAITDSHTASGSTVTAGMVVVVGPSWHVTRSCPSDAMKRR